MKCENPQTLDFLKNRIIRDYLGKHILVDGEPITTRPVLMTAHSGVGKTSVAFQASQMLTKLLHGDYSEEEIKEMGINPKNISMLQIPKDKKVECRVVDFHAMEPADFMGLPDKSSGRTIHLAPEWFPIEGDGTYGILLADEINRAERDVLMVFYNFILNRKIGNHKFSKNWIIVSACNPSETEDSNVNYDVVELDQALIGRFRMYGVAPDTQATIDFIESKYGPDNLVYQFLIADPDVIAFDGRRGTPRDFESLAKSLTVEGISTDIGRVSTAELKGISAADIGLELAASFTSFLNLRAFCTPDMILHGSWDQCHAGLLKAKEKGRFDVQTALMRAVVERYLKDENKPKVNNVRKFLESLEPDKAFASVQLMINRQQQTGESEMNKRIDELVMNARKHKSVLIQHARDIKAVSDS